MSLSDRIATLAARAWIAGLRALPPSRALETGARLGDVVRVAGVRRRVAEANLALAFPERDAAERGTILCAHYRELGRVSAEYARLASLVHAPGDEVVAEVQGLEHLIRARDQGRGAILLTGHFGNFELLGAWLGRTHPVSFVVKPLSNPGMERWIAAQRAAAGVECVQLGAGMRGAFAALRANRWVAMLADQDARRAGVFVPFMGRAASTPVGPATLALRSGAPIVMGFDRRLADGRHRLTIEPRLEIPDRDAPDAVLRLTAAHTARLEARVRESPEMWFWLHRRWKTSAP
ncbi:MAG: lysophospholipid acyltransferase family protein [Candidatus Eisenbacteria bacterium]|nr:lysophospholipid acyltransferase family protein [Candidatus Eisenbacteria bacterium]